MSRFEFTLATSADDAQLRHRLAADWMDGPIRVSFRREPSYFAGCSVQGDAVQVIICRERATGDIVGVGSRFLRTAFVNGQATRLGYLADLRAHPRVRRGVLLARGYRLLRQLHEQDPAPLYFSLILAGNQTALSNLAGGRAGLPHYCDRGRILTPALHLDFDKPRLGLPGVTVELGKPKTITAILDFIHHTLRAKQFAPVYTPNDIATPRLQGLQASDFYVAVKDNQIIGALAAWDQRSFRQTWIERYSPQLAISRPVYNLLARLTPLRPLPPEGSALPYFYISLVAIRGNDPEIFRLLLRSVYRDRRTGPWRYCIAGFHETDRLAAVLTDYRRIEAAGRFFLIHFNQAADDLPPLDNRVPHIDVATI